MQYVVVDWRKSAFYMYFDVDQVCRGRERRSVLPKLGQKLVGCRTSPRDSCSDACHKLLAGSRPALRECCQSDCTAA